MTHNNVAGAMNAMTMTATEGGHYGGGGLGEPLQLGAQQNKATKSGGYTDVLFTPYSGRPMWTITYGHHSTLQALAIDCGMVIDGVTGVETPAMMNPLSAGRCIPPPPPPPPIPPPP